MRSRLVSALMVRDEEARGYLPEVLDRLAKFSDLVVLDDGSTDGTRALCEAHPAVRMVRTRAGAGAAWGAEAPARRQLWELAREYGDWCLICDADMLLEGDPRELIQSTTKTAWAFVLYDLWNDRQHYREDGFWRGHLHARPWLFKLAEAPDAAWGTRGIHTGHAPNLAWNVGVAPAERYHWLHLAYVEKKDRDAKLAAYRAQAAQLTPFEKAHAESIVDPFPVLKPLPGSVPMKICIGGPVRKPVGVLAAHLETLAAQELPPGVQVEYCFVTDYPQPDPAEILLAEFVKGRGVVMQTTQRTTAADFDDQHPITHQWQSSAMARVGTMKQAIFDYALKQGNDMVWLVDADLLLDKTVLASLLSAQRAVVSAVYWTRWNKSPEVVMSAAPQVWLAPVYQLSKPPYYPESEFRCTLAERQLTQVGGLGACTLIHRSVIEKGVGFGKPPNFPTGGLWDGEDRHFCEWARRLHVDLWADAWPDIFHVYHTSDIQRIPEIMARLGRAHPARAVAGDAVSLVLTNLEDGAGTQTWRGTLNADALLPEIADTLLTMTRGETRVIRVHFPADYRLDFLRGQARLVQVTLVDCKPQGLAPVLEEDFHVSPGGLVADGTLYTAEQNELLGATNA